MSLSPEDIRQVQQLIDARMKHSRHENSDHLDQGLLPQKIAGSRTGGQVLTTLSASAAPVWNAAAGRPMAGGTTIYTSDATSASLAAGTDSSDIVTAITVNGDGITSMEVSISGRGPYITAGSAGHFDIYIWDGAITSGTAIGGGQFYRSATGIGGSPYFIRAYVAPFTGSKTFRVAFRSGVTSQTLVNQANASAPTMLTARWL